MTTDTIPTLAHAVRIGSDLSLYRERERAELVISHAAGGVLVELVDRRDYERERQRRIAAEMALRNTCDDASRQRHEMRDRHQKHVDELRADLEQLRKPADESAARDAERREVRAELIATTTREHYMAERDAAQIDAEITGLRRERDELKAANGALHEQVSDWHSKAVQMRTERDELADALHKARSSLQWRDGRLNQLQIAQVRMRDPERTMVCDILANGMLLDPAGSRYASPQPPAAAARQPLTDERIDAIADLVVKGMPDGIRGFAKDWGWRQFARALLNDCAGHYRAAEPTTAEPVLEIRACECGAAKNGRCVMGDYGALPIGTQLYAGAAPERAEPQPRPTCSSSGLLGALSGVGRECGMWIEGVCTSPEPCQHQQRPCRCGPDGCSDSVACPKGGAA